MYSEQELANAANRARENAPYFRGMDWENERLKWGRVATPWEDLYPNCLDDLAKVKNHEGKMNVHVENQEGKDDSLAPT